MKNKPIKIVLNIFIILIVLLIVLYFSLKDDYETIIGLDEELESNFGYTPMVFVVRDGKVVDVNEGYSEYTITGMCLEDFSIGGHSLNYELNTNLDKYIHIIIST